MKKLIFMLLTIASVCAFTANATAVESFNANASQKVKDLVKKYDLTVVDFDYVKKAVSKGTRASAKAVIVDARPEKKYEMGHIPSAISLPDTKFDTMYETAMKGIETSKELIIYCGGYECAKSPKLAKMLMDKGYKNIKIYPAGMPQWNKKSYSEIELSVAAALHEKQSALFIDARPYSKFVQSTIIGAFSVPDTKFKEFTGYMPASMNTTIVTFCGGYECAKSHNVANYLIMMGYKNVKVLASGFPSWKKTELPTTATGIIKKKEVAVKAVETFLKKGEDTGTVDGKWFVENYKSFPKTVTLVDVKGADEFKNGHIEGAININAEKMKPEELLAALPKEGEIVFYCGTGTRAMEAWGMLAEDLKYKDIHRVFYLDAMIKCDDKSNCSIEPNEPLGI